MQSDFQQRMKRKDFEDVDDDFSDFPFSSPATKIRRMDAELPPMVIVEEEPEVAAAPFDQTQRPPEQSYNSSGSWKIEELPDVAENEDRSIVLYKPSITNPVVHSPSNFSVSLDPQFISGLKKQILRSGQADSWKLPNDEDNTNDDSSSTGNECQAVVPWFPLRVVSGGGDNIACQNDSGEIMVDVEMGEAAMDVEEDSAGSHQRNTPSQGLPQWPHCTVLPPPENTTTPIVWYR